MNPPQSNYIDQKATSGYQAGIGELENSKIIRSIWKNTFDKILEIKISNKRKLKEMKETIMVEGRKKTEQKYKKQYNDTFTEKKIEVSTAKNEANLKKMNTKNELVNKAVEETLEKLKELTIECMVKLLEKECYLKIRKDDSDYMKSIIKECEGEYSNLMKKETKRDYVCKLTLLDDDFIEDEYGGIVMMNKDKKIIIKNGLKDRLMLTKEHHLPEIKNMLFPRKKKIN